MDKVQKIELEECIVDIDAALHSISNFRNKYHDSVFNTLEIIHCLDLIKIYTNSLKHLLKNSVEE
jgi:hypothetical protein|nr:MAG TPA: hypothetical protein [Caudoviricetes sp.]